MNPFATYPSLEDCPVLVSGGATGIGATLVSEFALQGARVAFIDIAERSGEELADALAGCRHAPLYMKADVTDLVQVQAVIADISGTLGPIRVLLNNAANDARQPVGDITPESWDRGFAVNLRHQFFAAQYVADGMKATGGSIINFGSISWMIKMPDLCAYASSKAAVHGLTRSLARELGCWGIRVNTLVPGWTMTEKQVREHLTDEGRAEISRRQCIDRPLRPEHVARMALFLASQDSEMCTGQEFIVDAGWA